MITSLLFANRVEIACRIIRKQFLPGTSAAWWVAGGKPPGKLGTAPLFSWGVVEGQWQGARGAGLCTGDFPSVSLRLPPPRFGRGIRLC